MSQPHFDLDRLRQSVSLSDVLTAAGIATPTRGTRMPCPIHGGTNRQAFSLRGDRWRCFGCGAHGDVIDLAQHLHGLTFGNAVAHVVRLAGYGGVDTVPRLTDATVSRRRAERERQQAEEASRGAILTRCAKGYHALTRAIGYALTDLMRNPDDAECWDYLNALYTRRDRVEAQEDGLRKG